MVQKSSRISVHYDIAGALREVGVGALLPHQRAKRLRRLPHIFSRNLELPVRANSYVQVQESPSSFIYKVALPPPLPQTDNIRAQIIQIIPGITMVRVAGAQIATSLLDELDIPRWRCRLPDCTLLEASTATCNDDGLLVLNIPKIPGTPSSLWQHYHDNRQSTPSLDADPEPAVRSDGLSGLGLPFFVASVSARFQGFNPSAPSTSHDDELSSQGVLNLEKDTVSDVKEHDASSTA